MIIGGHSGFEGLVVFGILQCAYYCLRRKSMADGGAPRSLFPNFCFWPSALERIAAIGLDLAVRGHGGPPAKLGSFCSFDPVALIALGNGCVFSQRARAAAVGSIPISFHQSASSPQ